GGGRGFDDAGGRGFEDASAREALGNGHGVGDADDGERGPDDADPEGADTEQLERGGEEHHDERRTDDVIGSTGGEARAEVHARNAADEDRGREAELEVAEQEMRDGGGGDERNGLNEIGAHELLQANRRVEHEQHQDHERAGADGGDADDEPADDADAQGGQRANLQRRLTVTTRGASTREQRAQDQTGSNDEQRDAERVLDGRLHLGPGAERLQQEHAEEGRGHRAEHQPQNEPSVHRAAAPVHGAAHGLHHHR